MIAQLNKEYIRTRPTKLFSRLVSYFFFEGRPLTTKGRWVNPFLFLVYKFISVLPQIKKVSSPIFIIGTGRSGSTLLGMLLSMHKNIGFLNEPKALWHFAFNKEDVIGSYSKGEAKYKLNETDVNAQESLRLKKLYAFFLSAVFSNRIVDKYPELIFRIEFVKSIFPDAKFLFLQRNGFDTSASTEQWIKNHRIESKNEIEDWWGLNNRKWKLLVEQVVSESKFLESYLEEITALNSPADMAAVEWIVSMEEGIYYFKKHPSDVLPVKYEELISHPETVLSKIFSFCNLKSDNTCLQYAKQITKPESNNKSEPQLPSYLKEIIETLMKDLRY